jgi:hypothetical protein
VRLGEVTEIRPERGRARVRLKLDPGVGDLPADTTAAVRGKGLLGARLIELEPGDSTRPLPEGAVIRESGNPITLGLSDALDTFDGETRGALKATVKELGTGLLGRGRGLNDALRRAPGAFADVRGLISALDARPGAVARLLPAVDAAMVPLADSRDDIAGGFAPAARALQPFVDRRAEVRATLDEAPPALAAAGTGLTEGRRLLAAARSLSAAVATTLPRAPRGLRAATRLLRDAPAPLRRTRVLLADLRPAVPALLRTTDSLAPVLAPLRRGLDDLTPLVAELGLHGCDLIEFGDNMRSVVNQGVPGGGPIGPLTSLRFTVIGGPESLSVVGGRPPQALSNDDEKFAPPCRYSAPPPTYGGGG